MFESFTLSSLIIDILIVAFALFAVFVGFYLGTSIRRQEQRLINLTKVVEEHGKDIDALRKKYKVEVDRDLKDKIKYFFIKERNF